MKNTICIDVQNDCQCDLIGNFNDGTNRIIIEILSDLSVNPKLNIFGGEVAITSPDFLYEISESDVTPSTTISFYISTDSDTWDVYKISIPEDITGNWRLKRLTSVSYEIIPIQTTISGEFVLPVATETTLGGIKVGKNLTIGSDGTLNATASVSVEGITNIRLEEILGGAAAIIETVPIITNEYIDNL